MQLHPYRQPHLRRNMKSCKTNCWRPKKANGSTAPRKAKQAMLIQQGRPWEGSTGPRTAEGEVKTSQNAYKGGTWLLMRDLARRLREQHEGLERLWQ
jgi:hypothetical protein